MKGALERKTFTFVCILPKKWWWSSDRVEYIDIQQATIIESMKYLRRKEEWKDEITMIILALEEKRGESFNKKERTHLIANGANLIKMRYETFLYWISWGNGALLTGGNDDWWAPEGAFFAYLAKELSTPITTILNEMTWEQVRELTNGLTRNANQLTDEGKLRNQNYKYKETFEQENDIDALREALQD